MDLINALPLETIKHLKYSLLRNNYFYFMFKCKESVNEGLTINPSVPKMFLSTWAEAIDDIDKDSGQIDTLDNLMKIAFQTYPEAIISVWDEYKDKIRDLIYPYTLMIQFQNTTLDEFKECLNSIQNQTLNEDTFFDVKKLQLICWGDIPDEIKEYDYSYEYPLLWNNLWFINTDDKSVADRYCVSNRNGVIMANIILINNVALYDYYIKGAN